MNKQECRIKHKKHFHHHKAPGGDVTKHITSGALENNDDTEDKQYSDGLVLAIAIVISALTMAMIYLSGAK